MRLGQVLVALSLASAGAKYLRRIVLRSKLDARREASGCFEVDVRYLPSNMAGQERALVDSASDCQARCLETPGCAHFSFYGDDGGCHLQDTNAFATHYDNAIAGPRNCEVQQTKVKDGSGEGISYGLTDLPEHDTYVSQESVVGKSVSASKVDVAAAVLDRRNSVIDGEVKMGWKDADELKMFGEAAQAATEDGATKLSASEAYRNIESHRLTMRWTSELDGLEENTRIAQEQARVEDEEAAKRAHTSMPCFTNNSQWLPLDMDGLQNRSVETDPIHCQARCTGAIGCAHFNFYADGGCHLSGANAEMLVDTNFSERLDENGTHINVISGPPICHSEIAKRTTEQARRLFASASPLGAEQQAATDATIAAAVEIDNADDDEDEEDGGAKDEAQTKARHELFELDAPALSPAITELN